MTYYETNQAEQSAGQCAVYHHVRVIHVETRKKKVSSFFLSSQSAQPLVAAGSLVLNLKKWLMLCVQVQMTNLIVTVTSSNIKLHHASHWSQQRLKTTTAAAMAPPQATTTTGARDVDTSWIPVMSFFLFSYPTTRMERERPPQ